MRQGLRDPLSAVRAIEVLENQMREMGVHVSVSTDMQAFADLRRNSRENDLVSPMFDPTINSFDDQNAFWALARDDDGKVTAFQACRLDIVDCNLSEWALRWMIGLYVMRSELAVPSKFVVPADSATQKMRGPFVYHGEMWINPEFRNEDLCTAFSRYALVLSLIKWQPNMVWGLIVRKLAARGLTIRMGYTHAERGFLKWSIPPKGADTSEYVTFAKKSDLEFLAHEVAATQS